MAKVLRAMAQEFLMVDPRIAPSLRGVSRAPPAVPKYSWRSPDLTTATDTHDVELTRHFYLEIGKRLPDQFPWYADVVNVVCGYYNLIGSTEHKAIRASVEKYFLLPPPDARFARMLGVAPIEPVKGDPSWILPYPHEMIRTDRGRVTKRGMPMGVSTSWPVLPLITLMSYERALGEGTVERQRRILKNRVATPDLSAFSRRLQGEKQATTLLKWRVPVGWDRIRTTGDDSIFPVRKVVSERFSRNIALVGGVLSKTKDVYHRHLAVYTEVFLRDGKPLGIFPWAPILAPRGVRQNTWFSQGGSVEGLGARHGVEIPLNRSPYWQLYRHLKEMGVDPSWPTKFGGLGIKSQYNEFGRTRLARALREKDLYELCGVPEDIYIPTSEEGLILLMAKTRQEMLDLGQALPEGPFRQKVLAMANRRPGTVLNSAEVAARNQRIAPSPMVRMTLKEWHNVYRCFLTWEQMLSRPQEEEEPTLGWYIYHHAGVRNSVLPDSVITHITDEAVADLEFTIEIPWGLLYTRGPTFGLILPCTPVPSLTVQVSERQSYSTSLHVEPAL